MQKAGFLTLKMIETFDVLNDVLNSKGQNLKPLCVYISEQYHHYDDEIVLPIVENKNSEDAIHVGDVHTSFCFVF